MRNFLMRAGNTMRVRMGQDASGTDWWSYLTISSWGMDSHGNIYLLTVGHGTSVGAPVQVQVVDEVSQVSTWENIGIVHHTMNNGVSMDFSLTYVFPQYHQYISYALGIQSNFYINMYDYVRTNSQMEQHTDSFYIRTAITDLNISANYLGYIASNTNAYFYALSDSSSLIQTRSGDSGSPVYYYDSDTDTYTYAGVHGGTWQLANGTFVYFFTPIWTVMANADFTPFTISGSCQLPAKKSINS